MTFQIRSNLQTAQTFDDYLTADSLVAEQKAKTFDEYLAALNGQAVSTDIQKSLPSKPVVAKRERSSYYVKPF